MSLSAPASEPADDIYKKVTVAATVFAVMFEAGYLLPRRRLMADSAI